MPPTSPAVYERILLMGGPGVGKTRQLVSIAQQIGGQMWVLDCEDKLSAFLRSVGTPPNLHLQAATVWEEVRETVEKWGKEVRPGNWVAVDRVDLTWPMVQRWFTREKYKRELADQMMKASQTLTKSAMLIPMFDQSDWLVINEQYDYVIGQLLYGLRCNVLLTSGLRALDKGMSPFETFSGLKVVPRGQKELAHQVHSAFALHIRKAGRSIEYLMTTGKDLPDRTYYEDEALYDFCLQYLGTYAPGLLA